MTAPDCLGTHSPWIVCPRCDDGKPSVNPDYLFAGLMALLIVAVFGTLIVWIVAA